MPAIWSSSERAISVRMVWVDGIRHAILSHDDPVLDVKTLQRRPQTTLSVKDKNCPLKFEPCMPTKSTENNFDACFVKLRLPIERSDSYETTARCLIRQQSAPICTRAARKSLPFRTNESPESESKNTQVLYHNTFSSIMDKEVFFNLEEKMKPLELPRLNTLSERVIQWLDLFGKAHDYELNDPFQRVVNNLKEEKIKPRLKSEVSNGTGMKIVLPTQSFSLQEKRIDSGKDFRKRKNLKCQESTTDVMQVRKIGAGIKKSDEFYKINSKDRNDESQENNVRLYSIWSPPGKTQLHIFMPSLRTTELQWNLHSSQESLICE